MGAYFQLLTPGIPELGGWVYMGPYGPRRTGTSSGAS